MDLTTCANELQSSYGSLADGNKRIKDALSADRLATVMGPAAVAAGTAGESQIETLIECHPTLKHLIEGSPDQTRGALQAAVIALARDASHQSAKAAVDEVSEKVRTQIAAPINASVELQSIAVNSAAAAGNHVRSLSDANKIGCSIETIEVRNEYLRLTTTLADKFRDIQTHQNNINESKVACDAIVADDTLSADDRSDRISKHKVLTDFSSQRVKEVFDQIHTLVSGQADSSEVIGDNNYRRQNKDLVDLEIPPRLKEDKRGALLAENIESYIRGREDCFATITPEIRRVSRDIANLRVVVFMMLAFVMEGRWDDVSGISPSHITDYGSYMVAFVEDSKIDQIREGEFVRFEHSGKELGVCNLLRESIKLLPEGTEEVSIFRRLVTGAKMGKRFRKEALGYTSMVEATKKALAEVGENPTDYGLHSFRAGGASLVAGAKTKEGAQLVPDRLQDKAGRWAVGSKARVGYIEETEENKALVPGILRI